MAVAGTDVRTRVLAAISVKPGIHLRELQRTVGTSLSGVTHHARALEKEGTVIGVSDRHYRRFFLASLVLPEEARRLDQMDRRVLAECRRGSSLAIILNLAAQGPMSLGDIGERMERSKRTVAFHMSRLVESGIVRSQPGSPAETFALVDRAHVIAVLVTFSGTLHDHIDRFARLWLALGD